MLTSYRRRTRAMVRAAGTPLYGMGVARTAKTLVEAAKRLAPYARAAGAKSSIQRKLGPVRVGPPKVKALMTRRSTAAVGPSADYDAPGNDYSKSVKRVGYKKKPTVNRLDRLLKATMNNQIYRFQNITQFDTNVGALPLAQQLVGTSVNLPLHIYDLTSFPNVGTYSPGRQFGWTTIAAGATVNRNTIPGQTAAGAADATGSWQLQEQSGASIPDANICMHNWSDVRLLLYGARKRSTVFDVVFFRCKDEGANPFHASGANTDLQQLTEWFTRGKIYNTIQTYDTKIAKKIQVVKQFKYYIPGSQTTDVDTSVGKVKEARIFLRHDKVYRLDWMDSANAQLPHDLPDGLDFTEQDVNQNTPWHSSRLFMAIIALSPERRVLGAGSNFTPADAASEPSYDIIIRNSFTTP